MNAIKPSSLFYAESVIKADSNIENSVLITRRRKKESMNWKKHELTRIKLNIDAAVNVDRNTVVVAGFIRDGSGECLGAFNANIGPCSPIFAEIWAVLHRFKWLMELGKDEVIVESDSLLALLQFLIRSHSRKDSMLSFSRLTF